MGLNARDLVASAAGRFAGNVDAESLVVSYVAQGDGRLTLVMEGVYHAHGWELGNDDDDGSNEWRSINTETDEDWDKCLQAKISKAENNGMYLTFPAQLILLSHHDRDKVRVRYLGRSPACVRPLKLRLINNASPVRAKPRQYTPEKREL